MSAHPFDIPAPTTLEQAIRERDAWIETAAFHCRNEDYYRGLVQACGRSIGHEAYVQDDGGVVDEVLCAKVPDLVERLVVRLREGAK